MLKKTLPDPEHNALGPKQRRTVTVLYYMNCQDSLSLENVPWLWRARGPVMDRRAPGAKDSWQPCRRHRAGSASPSHGSSTVGCRLPLPPQPLPRDVSCGLPRAESRQPRGANATLQAAVSSPSHPLLCRAGYSVPSLKSAARMQRIINIEIVSPIIYILLSHQHLAKCPQQQMFKVMTLNIC